MAKMPSIKDGWESYRKLVVPDNATEVQVKNAELTFFSGASYAYQQIMNAAGHNEKDANNILKNIHTEIVAFKKFVKEKAKKDEATTTN
jgi:hypothetical protein